MENLNTGQAVLKSLNAPGIRGVARVCWNIETLIRVDRHITSTLEIERVHFYVIIKLPPISFTLYRTQELLYGHIIEFWSRVHVSACVACVDMNE